MICEPNPPEAWTPVYTDGSAINATTNYSRMVILELPFASPTAVQKEPVQQQEDTKKQSRRH